MAKWPVTKESALPVWSCGQLHIKTIRPGKSEWIYESHLSWMRLPSPAPLIHRCPGAGPPKLKASYPSTFKCELKEDNRGETVKHSGFWLFIQTGRTDHEASIQSNKNRKLCTTMTETLQNPHQTINHISNSWAAHEQTCAGLLRMHLMG